MVIAVLVVALLVGCADTRVRPNNHLLPGITYFLTASTPDAVLPGVVVFNKADDCEARAKQLNAERPEVYLCVPIRGVRQA